MFKFDSDAHAYLSASNDLLEEIETRGFASAAAHNLLTKENWAALNDEWASRQAVLDAGAVGNYAEVVRQYRTAAIVSLAVGVTTFVAAKVYLAHVERTEAKRREARRKARAARRAGWDRIVA